MGLYRSSRSVAEPQNNDAIIMNESSIMCSEKRGGGSDSSVDETGIKRSTTGLVHVSSLASISSKAASSNSSASSSIALDQVLTECSHGHNQNPEEDQCLQQQQQTSSNSSSANNNNANEDLGFFPNTEGGSGGVPTSTDNNHNNNGWPSYDHVPSPCPPISASAHAGDDYNATSLYLSTCGGPPAITIDDQKAFHGFTADVSSCVSHGDLDPACSDVSSSVGGGGRFMPPIANYVGAYLLPYGGMQQHHAAAGFQQHHVAAAAAAGHMMMDHCQSMGYHTGPAAAQYYGHVVDEDGRDHHHQHEHDDDHSMVYGGMATFDLNELHGVGLNLGHVATLPSPAPALYVDTSPRLSLKRQCDLEGDGNVPPSKKALHRLMSNNSINNMNMEHDVPPFMNEKMGFQGGNSPLQQQQQQQQRGGSNTTMMKQRARQGTANDPQSIAARIRRERISERLKILQELVPNGSKVDLVTMLEKAISYVKFLQLQLKVLTTDEYWPSSTSLNKGMKPTSFNGVAKTDDNSAAMGVKSKPNKEDSP